MTDTKQNPTTLTHCGTQTITTERLTLRRFEPEDYQAMFDTWANDERVTRYLTWTPHGTPELTRQLVADWCSRYDSENYYNWAIEYDGQPIGNISVVRFTEETGSADLGYCMGYDFWGKGIMTEAASAVIDYLFEKAGVNAVFIGHAVKNPASGRVAQKCGLTLDGLYPKSFKKHDGELLDIAQYKITRSAWEKK